MNRRLLAAVTALATAGIAAGVLATAAARSQGPRADPSQFCVHSTVPPGQLCPEPPHDSPKMQAGYADLDAVNQRKFDVFSWQSFVALNWPATPDGKPLPVPFGSRPEAPRVWFSYTDPDLIFGLAKPLGKGATDALAAGKTVLHMMAKNESINGFLQTTGYPLIDRNLNFVVYQIKVDADEKNYIMSNGLWNQKGQAVFKAAGKKVDFPAGFEGGILGAIEIKAAWRILDPKVDALNRYYTTQAVVAIPAANSETGQPLTLNATVGLVGLHILHRTNNNSPYWIWSTFEQVDNTPPCPNLVDNTAPNPPQFSFYNPKTLYTVAPNAPPPIAKGQVYKWAAQPPYAAKYAWTPYTGGPTNFGTQVTRSFPIYTETQQVNREWQAKLAGTVWANYHLIGSQWGAVPDRPHASLEAFPSSLANTTIETYIQPTSNCIGCHKLAQTTQHQDANFSFLLGHAKPIPAAARP
jgi:hypothetical protein